MSLLRPSIPLEVKCRVVLRQLGEMFIDDVIEANRARWKGTGVVVLSKAMSSFLTPAQANAAIAPKAAGKSLGRLLADRLPKLAELLGCPLEELRLDHDPALGVREKIRRDGRTGEHIGYRPGANDPEFLLYRSRHGHHIKTNVRGDGAQYSDTTLMKRERRRLKKAQPKPCSRCFARYRIPPSRLCGRCQKVAKTYRQKVKRKWPSRSFRRKTR